MTSGDARPCPPGPHICTLLGLCPCSSSHCQFQEQSWCAGGGSHAICLAVSEFPSAHQAQGHRRTCQPEPSIPFIFIGPILCGRPRNWWGIRLPSRTGQELGHRRWVGGKGRRCESVRDGEVVPVTHGKLPCVHHLAEATHRERGMGLAVEENGEGSFWNPQPQPWYQSYSTGCILWGPPDAGFSSARMCLGRGATQQNRSGQPAHHWPQVPQDLFCPAAGGRTFLKTRVVTDRPGCLTQWGARGMCTGSRPYPRPYPGAPTSSPGLHHGTGGLATPLPFSLLSA